MRLPTFFNFAFSAVSSLPAFCAWRFSCFAVNLRLKRDFSSPDMVLQGKLIVEKGFGSLKVTLSAKT